MIKILLLLLYIYNVFCYDYNIINPICRFNYTIYNNISVYNNYNDYNLFIDLIDLNNNKVFTMNYTIINNKKFILDRILLNYLSDNIGCNCLMFRDKINVCFYYNSLDNLYNKKVSIKIYINNILKTNYLYDKSQYSYLSLKNLIRDFKIIYYNINYFYPNIDFASTTFDIIEYERYKRDTIIFIKYIQRLLFNDNYIKYAFNN
jgi:hypothetical protein